MANQTGIAIVIKAFLPTGKSLDEQFEALSIVKTAHETSDYSALLKAASIEEVKTEQKTRRIEDQPQTQTHPATQGETTETTGGETAGQEQPEPEVKPEPAHDPEADVPAFLKKDKKSKAA
ncbi:MAG: hypothetical protein E5X15_09935 [Mesorhizobium sp.]|uniref:hypothetical protein n=1 Tax=Mesorhizobium sp. TaxID=1871066 RepID=UPI000FE52B02|nr:hypothetical protein [Mesorhizobium sp.]RWF74520.1 MAG: hypothetical protein EOQ34_05175 [Mesorhizobium sp.]TIN82063.1 MAG: hypothetical protein E5X97_31640 [Mesorhizobium sp.]TIR78952.1 MAG: hypothetical protein E5X15_09935 [Mesorhizobium sp.]